MLGGSSGQREADGADGSSLPTSLALSNASCSLGIIGLDALASVNICPLSVTMIPCIVLYYSRVYQRRMHMSIPSEDSAKHMFATSPMEMVKGHGYTHPYTHTIHTHPYTHTGHPHLLIWPQPIRRQCLSTRRESAIFSPTCTGIHSKRCGQRGSVCAPRVHVSLVSTSWQQVAR